MYQNNSCCFVLKALQAFHPLQVF